MKFVIQRVSSAKVEIIRDEAGTVTGTESSYGAGREVIERSIGRGFVVLIGICNSDTKEIADKLIHKLINLRIFQDENGKTNLNIDAVNGEMLIISQFTLYADCRHGNRPSFVNAGEPRMAEELYNYIVDRLREALAGASGASSISRNSRISTGEFGADMKVSLTNDGPFTIIFDSDDFQSQ